MKIERKVAEKESVFNIDIGDCFTFGGSIFMRVGYDNLELDCPECNRELDADDLFCNTGASYLAVELCSGELYQFTYEEEVIPIKMKAVEV